MIALGRIPCFDAHAHLADARLSGVLDEVLSAAAACGVTHVACCGTSPADWPTVEEIARLSWPVRVIPCFGLHPWFVAEAGENWLGELEAVLRRWPEAPVGEIGLDCWKEPVDRDAQERAFRAQWALAARLGRPAIVHCLRTWGWLEEVLDSLIRLDRFMLHGFGGPAELVASLTARGAWFSFAGSVLASGRTRQQAALRAVPGDRLLVESDAPDMAPPAEFCRVADQSEPANTPAVLAAIAALRGDSPADFAASVYQNSLRFFDALHT